ncbi:MAG: hypothetical protein ACWGO1_09530, partial [Anaerolineales bacterium]
MTGYGANKQLFCALLLSIFILSACGVQNPQPQVLLPSPTPARGLDSATPLPSTPTQTAAPPTPTETPQPPTSVWLPSYLPETLAQSLQLAPDIVLSDDPQTAEYRFQVGGDIPLSHWVY